MSEPNWENLYLEAKGALVSLESSGFSMDHPARLLISNTLKGLNKKDQRTPALPLQIYGWDGFYEDIEQEHWGGYRRHICAAHSIEEIEQSYGITISRSHCSVTGNNAELMFALASPGVLFVEAGKKPQYPKKYMVYPEYKRKKKAKV